MYTQNKIFELEVGKLNVTDDLMINDLSIKHISHMPIQGNRIIVDSNDHRTLNDSFTDLNYELKELHMKFQQLMDFLRYKNIIINDNEFAEFLESRKVVEKLNGD